MNRRILRALIRKEVTMMRRNPIIPKVIFIMPVMVMLILPLVATLDVKNINVAIVDHDRSHLSRRLAADMDATAELNIADVFATHDEAVGAVEKGDADVIVTIPVNWEEELSALDVESNGVNATKGMLGARYVSASAMNTIGGLLKKEGITQTSAQPTVTDRYNPTLNFKNFMIPALMVILLIIICGFLPALNLVSEKETGTVEALNVSPVSRLELVLAKLIPFWIIGILVITTGMIIGSLAYGLAPAGNIGAIYLASILFSFTMSGLGVAVANRSSTMLQSIFVMFAIIIIFQLMGGLFTPISSMPEWAQIITYAVPPRYFNEIMRAIYLKGASVTDLWVQYTCLTAIAAAVCLLAALTYRKRN